MAGKSILFVINVDWFFISHRLVLAENALKAGYRVKVLCQDTGRMWEIREKGLECIDLKLDRSGTNPLKELLSLVKYYTIYRRIKPDVIHHITLKPVVYGSIAARILRIPILNAVSGLGYNLSEEKKGLSKWLMIRLMRWGFRHKNLISIFQNNDDLNALKQSGIIKKDARIVLIKGAGVDLHQFPLSPPADNEKLEIILPARMLWDKGIKEFKQASELLKSKYAGRVLFRLIGVADRGNKAGIEEEELMSWLVKDYFVWTKFQENMVPWLQQSDIVVLPSYREGMPKSLLEACAIGRPIVTTNAIGCKECVEEGINGYKVKPRDVEELALAIEKLIVNKDLRIKFGNAGRQKAEREFDVKEVIKTHLELYEQLAHE